MTPTLASAPGSCCFSGVKHIGTPVGRVEDLDGIPTYIPDPTAATQKVILFLADCMGSAFRYIVLGADYFFGDSVPNHLPDCDRQAWIDNSRKPAIDAFPAWLDAVKGKYGYCFGASFVVDFCSDGAVVAEEEHTFPLASRRRAEDIMVARKSTYYFQVFSGVQHGFVVRGDPAIDTQRWAKEESARGIVSWFDRFTV
ncbi:uncharacterized protein F5147DRAFT_724478 [Suillus discolor]|uniref:Dienelactone hydrolase domain-containing protein n=1 Tax=Suillus discolor TaxID=1912936 RepID=A0A9P7JN12_9AGAM|nr:uncharacterized protein F5147DRAFT_724478 [Suillus discolor]KAG2090774.1 hypothetical protein F5147DRAFT_724478 [Suillus discolor]